jgi:hypothetical protein
MTTKPDRSEPEHVEPNQVPRRQIVMYKQKRAQSTTEVKGRLHVGVNCRESSREYLATTFRRESKSWQLAALLVW